MPMAKRAFTRREDEMIVANSEGRMPISELLSHLQSGMTTVTRRADELGVELVTYPVKRNKHNCMPRTDTFDEYGKDNPYSVGSRDRLLARLVEHHADRLYHSCVVDRRDRVMEILPMADFKVGSAEFTKPSLSMNQPPHPNEKMHRALQRIIEECNRSGSSVTEILRLAREALE